MPTIRPQSVTGSVLILCALVAANPTWAQSAEELAKATANPVADLIAVPL